MKHNTYEGRVKAFYKLLWWIISRFTLALSVVVMVPFFLVVVCAAIGLLFSAIYYSMLGMTWDAIGRVPATQAIRDGWLFGLAVTALVGVVVGVGYLPLLFARCLDRHHQRSDLC